MVVVSVSSGNILSYSSSFISITDVDQSTFQFEPVGKWTSGFGAGKEQQNCRE